MPSPSPPPSLPPPPSFPRGPRSPFPLLLFLYSPLSNSPHPPSALFNGHAVANVAVFSPLSLYFSPSVVFAHLFSLAPFSTSSRAGQRRRFHVRLYHRTPPLPVSSPPPPTSSPFLSIFRGKIHRGEVRETSSIGVSRPSPNDRRPDRTWTKGEEVNERGATNVKSCQIDSLWKLGNVRSVLR